MPEAKHTKWLGKVVATVAIADDGVARFYLGLILIDKGKVTPDGILRDNGMYVRDAWQWMDDIERLLCVTI